MNRIRSNISAKNFIFRNNQIGEDVLYFTGNSLGLQPKTTREYIEQELKDWETLGVEGHFAAKNPWMPYHEIVDEQIAKIVGAKTIGSRGDEFADGESASFDGFVLSPDSGKIQNRHRSRRVSIGQIRR